MHVPLVTARIGSLVLATTYLLGCALPMNLETSQVSVWARSHNRSDVDVYLLCGDRDATWLGLVHSRETAALEFPAGRARCTQGLNFFLVTRDHHHGYWVGPMYPQAGGSITLVIEKYAGLSSADLPAYGR